MTTIKLNQVTRRFGDITAVDNITLAIPSGSLFFLLGPSGCGKTTLLRLISGLDIPTSGEIWFDSVEVSAVPIERRNVGIVFQQYALWPHMSVTENIRFGLTQRGMNRHDQRERIDEVLTLTQLTPLAKRLPSELSGGQQQRVALARALALKPALLLFDEPLSNLDPHLRHEIREELIQLHHSLPTTMIYITHDTEEALSMADTVAILNRGSVVQSGSPHALFHLPSNEFVANFLGESTILEGAIIRGEGQATCRIGETIIVLPQGIPLEAQRVRLVIRPHYLTFPAEGPHRISGTILRTVFAGPVTRVTIALSRQDLSLEHAVLACLPSYRCRSLTIGMPIEVGYDPETLALVGTEAAP